MVDAAMQESSLKQERSKLQSQPLPGGTDALSEFRRIQEQNPGLKYFLARGNIYCLGASPRSGFHNRVSMLTLGQLIDNNENNYKPYIGDVEVGHGPSGR